jgi:hypothetical protein
MRTPSKSSSAVKEARMPSLSVHFWPSRKPGMPFSTRKLLISRGAVAA